jgi:hypothetical protein
VDLQRHNVERQLQRLIDAYQAEVLTLQELAPRREQLTQRLKGLEQERQQIEQQRDTTIKWEHIASNIEHFRTLLGSNVDHLCFEDRQTVAQLLVEKVVVSRDGAVEVHHGLPFEEQPVAADQKKKGIPPEFYVLRLQHLDLPSDAVQGADGLRTEQRWSHSRKDKDPPGPKQRRVLWRAPFLPTLGTDTLSGHIGLLL